MLVCKASIICRQTSTHRVFGVQTCWAQVFILPKRIMKLIMVYVEPSSGLVMLWYLKEPLCSRKSVFPKQQGAKGHTSDLLEQSCNPETFVGYSRNTVHCVSGRVKEACYCC